LEFVEGELSSGTYEDCIKGCDGVIHLATAYLYSSPDPQKEIVEPAVEGVRSMLQACLKTPSIKRVVITSSGGAILHFPVDPGYMFTDKDWNRWSSLTNNPYFYSKRLAEEAGWDLWNANKDKFDFAVVNPLLVFGPPQTPHLNASQQQFQKILMGETKTLQPSAVGVTDVRDVAQAHVIALTDPRAVGKRLICYSETVTWKGMAKQMKNKFPEYPVTVEEDTDKPTWTMDTNPLKEMGMTSFHPWESMVNDTIEAFIKLGVVPDLRKK